MGTALALTDTSYIYVIGHDDEPQKIGFSHHPPSRARSLKVARQPHFKVHWWVAVSASQVHELERLVHWLLRDKALGRERFDITPQEAINALQDAAAQFDAGVRAPRVRNRSSAFGVTLSVDTMRIVEAWRIRQRPIPNLSATLRHFLLVGAEVAAN